MKPGQISRRPSCTRGPYKGNVLVLALLLCTPAWASGQALEEGHYEIVAQTVMPHLEENLRYAKTRERRCLHSDDVSQLFPILRHSSLEGCTLGDSRGHDNTLRYVLVCARPDVASGEARLNIHSGRVSGILEIKMGGKNMTFAQRIDALRQGECKEP
jgi:hypothetical protein